MPKDVVMASNTITEHQADSKQDITWILGLYGTAIGAGTLFLPIDAGINGIWPLIILAMLAFPMTYFSHQALCRFVLSGTRADHNITDVVEEHFGAIAGTLLTFLYFFAIFPILLMYSVALTNTVHSFMQYQLHLPPPARSFLAFLLIAGLMAIIRVGQDLIIKSMSLLVYPFVAILLAFSIYLIPEWNGAILTHSHAASHPQSLLTAVWLIIPVMIFSFNHSPIISSFAVSQKKRFGAKADAHCSRLLRKTHLLMIGTVLLFTFSCVLSLTPEDLLQAKAQNISILSYLANHFHTPFIAYIAPLVAFIAIAKSFLGHYLGAREGLEGLVQKTILNGRAIRANSQSRLIIDTFMVVSCWVIATINPNILTMIETLGGPVIAIILFLMPMYAIATVPAMQHYKSRLSNGFIAITGSVALAAILYGLWGALFK